MLYKRVEIKNGETTEPVSFVGVHPIAWPRYVGEPEVAFAEVDEDTEALRAAGDELAEKASVASQFVADTELVIGKRALDGLWAAIEAWREATGEGK